MGNTRIDLVRFMRVFYISNYVKLAWFLKRRVSQRSGVGDMSCYEANLIITIDYSHCPLNRVCAGST